MKRATAATQNAGARPITSRATIDTDGLKELLSCGYPAAIQIGEQAHAKVRVGRRVLWNVAKIQRYLDEINE